MKDGKYESFDELRSDYQAHKISLREYVKYFSSMTGQTNDGYPDFSEDYHRLFAVKTDETRVVKKKTPKKRAPKKKTFAVVVYGEANDYGDIKVLYKAFVFPTMKAATVFLLEKCNYGKDGSLSSSRRLHLSNGAYYQIINGEPGDKNA